MDAEPTPPNTSKTQPLFPFDTFRPNYNAGFGVPSISFADQALINFSISATSPSASSNFFNQQSFSGFQGFLHQNSNLEFPEQKDRKVSSRSLKLMNSQAGKLFDQEEFPLKTNAVDRIYDALKDIVDNAEKAGILCQKKKAVPIYGSERSDASEKEQILTNYIGVENFCWTCNKRLDSLEKTHFIADHIPPYGLKEEHKAFVREYVNMPKDIKYYLYPSCVACSQNQSSFVSMLNLNPSALDDALAKYKNDLYGWSVWATNRYDIGLQRLRSIVGGFTPKIVDDPEEKAGVAALRKDTNKTDGNNFPSTLHHCHICGSRSPVTAVNVFSGEVKYRADHFPPRMFRHSKIPMIIKILAKKDKRFESIDQKWPSYSYLLPQCMACSDKQGGYGQVAKDIYKLADAYNITIRPEKKNE